MLKRGFIAVFFLIFACSAYADECDNWQTDHPDWILCEDWETGQIDTAKWNDGQTTGINNVVNSEAFDGSYSLEMTHPSGDTGGYLNSIWYHTGYNKYLDHGFEHLYARWYFKAGRDFESTTKIAGFSIKKSDMSSFWNDHTGAGIRPDGYTNGGGFRIVTGSMTAGNIGEANFYTYHTQQMLDRWSNGGTLYCMYYGDATAPPPSYVDTPGDTDGSGNYYCSWDRGTEYASAMADRAYDEYVDGDRHIEKERWYCIEAELLLNTPGQNDAELRFWMDDVLKGEWIGVRFREQQDMAIHMFQLTASSPADHGLQHSYFDNIVISTNRIGCLGDQQNNTDPVIQCTEADTDSDGHISNQELNMYIESWNIGDVSTLNLMDAIEKWKNGCSN